MAELAKGRRGHGCNPDLDIFEYRDIIDEQIFVMHGRNEGGKEGIEVGAEFAKDRFLRHEWVVGIRLVLELLADSRESRCSGILIFNIKVGDFVVTAAALIMVSPTRYKAQRCLSPSK